MLKKVLKELILAMIAGILPLFICYLIWDMEKLIVVLKGLMAQDFVLYYSMCAGAVALIYSFVHYRIRFTSSTLDKLHRQSAILLLESAIGFLSIMRLSGGILIFSFLFWLVYDRNIEHFAGVSYLLSLGIVLLLECVVISGWVNIASTKWVRH